MPNPWQFYHQDQINSVYAVTNAAGSVLERYLYDPFGLPDVRDASWGARTLTAIGNPWLFTGQEWRSDLGLSNYKARWYQPTLGRFMQNDPVRFDAGDLNLYRYCGNDPLNRIDPSGEREVDIYIWEQHLIPGPTNRWAGHVMITEANSTEVKLSQYMKKPGEESQASGPNTKFEYRDTMIEQKDLPTKIFRAELSNDVAFDASVADHVGRKTWDYYPDLSNETHCSRAGYDALQAGGLPLPKNDKQVMPGTLGRELDKLAKPAKEGEKQKVRRIELSETPLMKKPTR